MAPLHQPVVADLGRLRQSGGTRGIDVERRGVDRRRVRTPKRGSELSRQRVELRLQRRKSCALDPNTRQSSSAGRRARIGGDARREIGADDQMPWVRDVDGVRQYVARELRIDERDHDADARQAQPYRQILGAVRHQQRYGIAARKSVRDSPAGILIAANAQLAVSSWRLRRTAAPARRRIRRPSRSISTGSVIALLADGCGLCQRPQPGVASEFCIDLAGLRHGNGHLTVIVELRTIPRLPASFEIHCSDLTYQKLQE